MRIAIVAFHFCGEKTIGAKRWREMAELLSLEHDVTAFCADASSAPHGRVRVVPVEDTTASAPVRNGFVDRPHNNKLLRFIFHLGQSFLFWPDRQKWWARRAVGKLSSFADEPFDVVVTSGPRFSVHSEMRRWLRRSAWRPFWVMDLRDPWTNDPSPAMRRRTPNSLTRIEAHMEAACHRRADLVTTVSDVMSQMMKRDFGSRAVTIFNGYAETAGRAGMLAADATVGSIRSICYLGSIIHGLRSPALLFEAAGFLEVPASRMQFDFWCNDPELVLEEALDYGVGHLVRCHRAVPFSESLKIQRRATANLVLNGTDSTSNHMITGKVFELIASERPILAVTGPQSELRSVLEQCGCNGIIWNSETAQSALRALMQGELAPVCDTRKRFSRRAAVEELVRAIEGLRYSEREASL